MLIGRLPSRRDAERMKAELAAELPPALRSVVTDLRIERRWGIHRAHWLFIGPFVALAISTLVEALVPRVLMVAVLALVMIWTYETLGAWVSPIPEEDMPDA